jgi:hypothetical protein
MFAAILTLIGTLAGAAIGLMAPFFSAALASKQSTREIQGQIASSILDLFQDGRTLAASLTSPDSETRRKLYLLAMRLSDDTARRSCMELIAYAGGPDPDPTVMQDTWNVMINSVGSVYRSRRRAE